MALDLTQPAGGTLRLAVLVASYNRAAVTLRGLSSLRIAIGRDSRVMARYFLLDDNSPDGTAERVRTAFPDVEILGGTGALFWARGMCRAYQAALAADAFDGYLLFNDDVVLAEDAFVGFVSAFLKANRDGDALVSGALVSPLTGQATFGGVRVRRGLRPRNFEQLSADGTLQSCDTVQGNCLLVPAPLMHRLGGLDQRYHHAYADVDLGFAARRSGARLYLSPATLGLCERDAPWKYDLRTLPLGQRLRTLLTAPEPVSDFALFVFRHRPLWQAIPISAYYGARRIWRAIFP